MTYLLFGSAIMLSVMAEYYSIMGLMAIFSSSPISICIMGIVLGISKLVITSWLYRNWRSTKVLMKVYFILAIIILMFLTSIGVFGYLSKAHLDQSIQSKSVISEVRRYDDKISEYKNRIEYRKKAISQLDAQVDASLSRTVDMYGVERSNSIRKQQSKERDRIQDEIVALQSQVDALESKRDEKGESLAAVESKIGPIRYVAEMFYGDNPSEDLLEKSVRFLIVLIVLVFDPLALLMLIAFNQSIKPKQIVATDVPVQNKSQKKKPLKQNDLFEIDSSVRADDNVTIEKW